MQLSSSKTCLRHASSSTCTIQRFRSKYLINLQVPNQSARVISCGTCEAGERIRNGPWFSKGINIEEQPILDMLDCGEQDHANDMLSVLK